MTRKSQQKSPFGISFALENKLLQLHSTVCILSKMTPSTRSKRIVCRSNGRMQM